MAKSPRATGTPRITVTFTREEQDELNAAAKKSGLERSVYIRVAALERARGLIELSPGAVTLLRGRGRPPKESR